MEYDTHPAAEIFPLMSEQEFDGLVTDIREYGLREPIILFEGKVLDGRNRLRACQKLGIEPNFIEWPNGEDPCAYVVSKNLHRRHLNESQRAMVAAKMANMDSSDTRMTGSRPANLQDGKISVPKAAEMLNVGERTVRNAKRTLKDGTPEEIKAVESGGATVSGTNKKIQKRKGASTGANRIRVPDGLTVEDYIRQGIILEGQGKSAEAVAKHLHINQQVYRNIRNVVALSDMTLSESDAEIVKTALSEINATQQVSRHYEPVKPIVEKIWGAGRAPKTDARLKRRLADFERAFGHVIHACISADQIDIPNLGVERATKAVGEITQAQRHLNNLKSKLKELYS